MCTTNNTTNNTATTYPRERWTKAGQAMHTCNGDVISGLPFGRKAEPGECRRCDELRAGAPARQTQQSIRAAEDAARLRDIRNHDCKKAGCGPVCVYGDW